MEKILTVSVAAYNVEGYIRQTLSSLMDESVIDQLDILVNDDGGQDGTLAIAREFEEKYPRSVRIVHKENGGYGSVINTNLPLARGKYFKLLDGDDAFETAELPAFLRLLESIDADCVLTRTKVFREDLGTTRIADRYPETTEGLHRFDETVFNSCLTMHSVTLRTGAIQDKQIAVSEHCFYTDVEFVNNALLYLETFYVYPHALYVYRKGVEGQSVSWTGRKKHYKEHETVFWKTVRFYEQIGEPNKKRLVANRVKNSIRAHLGYFFRFPVSRSNYREYRRFAADVHRRVPELEKSVADQSLFWKLVMAGGYRLYLLPRIAARAKDSGVLSRVRGGRGKGEQQFSD